MLKPLFSFALTISVRHEVKNALNIGYLKIPNTRLKNRRLYERNRYIVLNCSILDFSPTEPRFLKFRGFYQVRVVRSMLIARAYLPQGR